MLVHFGETFVRFAGRYERRKSTTIDRKYLVIGVVAALVPLLYFASKAMPPRYARDQFRWADAGKLPMMHEGRIKPLDTVARNLLLAASNRSKLYDKDGHVITATEWLVASMANADWTKEIGCIRIDAQEVLDEIGLKRREGHRYSFAEVSEKIGDVRAKLQRLDPNDREKWSFVDNKWPSYPIDSGFWKYCVLLINLWCLASLKNRMSHRRRSSGKRSKSWSNWFERSRRKLHLPSYLQRKVRRI